MPVCYPGPDVVFPGCRSHGETFNFNINRIGVGVGVKMKVDSVSMLAFWFKNNILKWKKKIVAA